VRQYRSDSQTLGVICATIVVLCFCASCTTCADNFGTAIHVPLNVSSITEAIVLAVPGDSIYVHSGVYPDFRVNKPIALIGVDDGIGLPQIELPSKRYGITISGSGASVDGFVLIGTSSRGGIYVSASNIVLRNISVTGQPVGIRAENTANLTITNSYIQGNMFGISLDQAYRSNIFFNNINNIDGYNIGGWAVEPQMTMTPLAYRYNGEVYIGPLGNFWGEMDSVQTERGVYLDPYSMRQIKQIDTRATLTGQPISLDTIPSDPAPLVADITSYEILSEAEYQTYIVSNPITDPDVLIKQDETLEEGIETISPVTASEPITGTQEEQDHSSGLDSIPLSPLILIVCIFGLCVMGYLFMKKQERAKAQFHRDAIQVPEVHAVQMKPKMTIPTDFPASYAHRYHDISFVHRDTESLIFSATRKQDGHLVWVIFPMHDRLKSRDPTELYIWRTVSSSISHSASNAFSQHIAPLLTEGNFPVSSYEIPAYRAVLSDIMQNTVFSKKEIGTILTDILHAIDACHKQGVLHLNIRPDTIALVGADRAVLIGLTAARMTSEQPRSFFPAKPYQYYAPEQLSPHERLSTYTDIYQFGVIWYEFASGTSFSVADESDEPIAIWEKISSQTYLDEKMSLLDPIVSGIISACLSPDKASRPTCETLIAQIRELYLN
jgi:hypothetical protein